MGRFHLDVLLPLACVGLLVWGFTRRSEDPAPIAERVASSRSAPGRATPVGAARSTKARPSDEERAEPGPSEESGEALDAEAVPPASVTDSSWIQEQYPHAFRVGELPALEETSAFSEIYDDAALALKQARLAEVWPEVRRELTKLRAAEETPDAIEVR